MINEKFQRFTKHETMKSRTTGRISHAQVVFARAGGRIVRPIHTQFRVHITHSNRATGWYIIVKGCARVPDHPATIRIPVIVRDGTISGALGFPVIHVILAGSIVRHARAVGGTFGLATVRQLGAAAFLGSIMERSGGVGIDDTVRGVVVRLAILVLSRTIIERMDGEANIGQKIGF